ncbi:MAG: hypothetical protein OHK0015_21030 [Chloroflexi bacterium OHK40]
MDGAWVDVTIPGGGAEGMVCGTVSSLSPFTIAQSGDAPTSVPPTPPPTFTPVPPTPTPTHTPTATAVPSTPTPAPPACTASTVTYNASADARLDQGSRSNNYASDSILKVQAKSSSNFRDLVRFDMPVSPPEGCVVQTATLRLYAASHTSNRTLQAF